MKISCALVLPSSYRDDRSMRRRRRFRCLLRSSVVLSNELMQRARQGFEPGTRWLESVNNPNVPRTEGSGWLRV